FFPGNNHRQRASHRRICVRKGIRLRLELLEDRTLLSPTWVSEGPTSIVSGQSRIPTQNNPVAGAVSRLAADPADANLLYAGTVNGGVWKTTNALAASPTWTPLTDDIPDPSTPSGFASLSIGALELDPADHTHIVAGIGRFSSDARIGGP